MRKIKQHPKYSSLTLEAGNLIERKIREMIEELKELNGVEYYEPYDGEPEYTIEYNNDTMFRELFYNYIEDILNEFA
jgi:hypothetical protein